VHLLPSEPASDEGIAAYLHAQPDLPAKWLRLKVTADGFGPSFGFEFNDGTRVPMFIDTGAAQTSFPDPAREGRRPGSDRVKDGPLPYRCP